MHLGEILYTHILSLSLSPSLSLDGTDTLTNTHNVLYTAYPDTDIHPNTHKNTNTNRKTDYYKRRLLTI